MLRVAAFQAWRDGQWSPVLRFTQEPRPLWSLGDAGRGAQPQTASALLLLVQGGRSSSRKARVASVLGGGEINGTSNRTNADGSAPIRRVHQRQAGGPVETPRLCLVASVVRVVEGRSSLCCLHS